MFYLGTQVVNCRPCSLIFISATKRQRGRGRERERERERERLVLRALRLGSVLLLRFGIRPNKATISKTILAHKSVSNQRIWSGNEDWLKIWMANLYVKAVPPADPNKNTEWFMYPGVWTTYILILFFSWLLVLSIFGCSPGMAWTIVNIAHFAVRSYSLLLSIFIVFFEFWVLKSIYWFFFFLNERQNSHIVVCFVLFFTWACIWLWFWWFCMNFESGFCLLWV